MEKLSKNEERLKKAEDHVKSEMAKLRNGYPGECFDRSIRIEGWD